MKTARILVAAILLGGISSAAWADLTPVGDPQGEDWAQQFNESGVGLYDLVAVQMSSAGDYFQNPTHSGFTADGWALLYEDSPPTTITLGSASGPSVTNMNWWVNFFGSTSNPLVFDYVAFNGQTIVSAAHAVWGPGWTITNYGTNPSPYWNPSLPEVVPAPGAALLAAMGLGLVGWVRRRFS